MTVTAPGQGLLFVDTTGRRNLRGSIWQEGVVLASGPTSRPPAARLGARVEAGPIVVAVAGRGGATGAYEVTVTVVRGYVDNPAGVHSFQSGLGVLSGWVCEAETVEIVFETAPGCRPPLRGGVWDGAGGIRGETVGTSTLALGCCSTGTCWARANIRSWWSWMGWSGSGRR